MLEENNTEESRLISHNHLSFFSKETYSQLSKKECFILFGIKIPLFLLGALIGYQGTKYLIHEVARGYMHSKKKGNLMMTCAFIGAVLGAIASNEMGHLIAEKQDLSKAEGVMIRFLFSTFLVVNLAALTLALNKKVINKITQGTENTDELENPDLENRKVIKYRAP